MLRRSKMYLVVSALLVATALVHGARLTPGSSSASAPAGVAGTDAEWQPLFDGRTLEGWRGFKRTDVPESWKAVDGELRRVAAGGDIITDRQFENFELSLEWKVAPGGNSGVFYRATEEAAKVYYSGPEMQVLDDERHEDGESPLTSAGAIFAIYPAKPGVVKPANEWNEARLVANGAHIEHWLNGVKVVEAEQGSPDWQQRVAESKFKTRPSYGQSRRGHIGLQDHGDEVAFRNIRIRVMN